MSSRSVSWTIRYFGWLFGAILLLAPLAAYAGDSDRVQFGNTIAVHEGEEIQDAVCFFCSIEADGEIHGDMVAFFGNIRVRGKADGDAVAFLGNIGVGQDASIGGDTVVFGGNLHMAEGATIGKDRVIFPFIFLLMPLLVFAGIIAFIVWFIRRLAYRPPPVYGIPPRV